MHVLQWIAIQADEKDMALRTVQENLSTLLGDYDYPTNTWFDWFIAGGGRWNMSEDDDNNQAYVEGKSNMVISYDEDPKAFREQIEQSMQDRKAEFDNYAKDVDVDVITKIINSYDPKEFDFPAFQSLYVVKKVIDMAYGNWDYNAYFFDMATDSTTPKYVYESIDKGNKNWYLVPVDFHF